MPVLLEDVLEVLNAGGEDDLLGGGLVLVNDSVRAETLFTKSIAEAQQVLYVDIGDLSSWRDRQTVQN